MHSRLKKVLALTFTVLAGSALGASTAHAQDALGRAWRNSRFTPTITYRLSGGLAGQNDVLTISPSGTATIDYSSFLHHLPAGSNTVELTAERHEQILGAFARSNFFGLPRQFRPRAPIMDIPSQSVSVRILWFGRTVRTLPAGVDEPRGFAAFKAELEELARELKLPPAPPVLQYNVSGGLVGAADHLTIDADGLATLETGSVFQPTTSISEQLSDDEHRVVLDLYTQSDFFNLPDRFRPDRPIFDIPSEAVTVTENGREKVVRTLPLGVNEPAEFNAFKQALAKIAQRLRESALSPEIEYELSGGLIGTSDHLTVDGNGLATLEFGSIIHPRGVASVQLSADEHGQLLDELAGADFFNLPDRFEPTSPIFDLPGETVTVRQGGRSKQVSTLPLGVNEPQGFNTFKRSLADLAHRLREQARGAASFAYNISGGLAGTAEHLVIDAAGNATLDLGGVFEPTRQVTGTLTDAEKTGLADALAAANFFALPDRFLPRAPIMDIPGETVTVTQGDRNKSVQTLPAGVDEPAGFATLKAQLRAIMLRLRADADARPTPVPAASVVAGAAEEEPAAERDELGMRGALSGARR